MSTRSAAEPTRILFAFTSQPQLDDAQAVARQLAGSSAFLNLHDGRISAAADATSLAHYEAGTAGALFASRRMWRQSAELYAPDVVVLGQDAGIRERAFVAAARAASPAPSICLMPDGIVSYHAPVPAASQGLDVALRIAGLAAGRRYIMGSTRPDLVLSWGQAWEPYWRDFGAQEVLNVGSPRMGALVSSVPAPEARPQVLICSSPAWQFRGVSHEECALWYGQLLELAHAGRVGHLPLRIRLHPSERVGHPLFPQLDALRMLGQTDASLADDLTWSTVVAGLVSTVLVEAAACGRQSLLVVPGDGTRALADSCPAFQEQRLPRCRPEQLADLCSTAGVRTSEAHRQLRTSLAADPMTASTLAAEALERLAMRART
jgi:hypothetical protein